MFSIECDFSYLDIWLGGSDDGLGQGCFHSIKHPNEKFWGQVGVYHDLAIYSKSFCLKCFASYLQEEIQIALTSKDFHGVVPRVLVYFVLLTSFGLVICSNSCRVELDPQLTSSKQWFFAKGSIILAHVQSRGRF